MSKKFDFKKLEKQILKEVAKQISKDGFEIECPGCKTNFLAHGGANTCPKCGSNIDFSVDIKH